MRGFILGTIAVLFVISVPFEAGAQVVFFYKEMPEMALDNENIEIQTSVKLKIVGYRSCGPYLHVRVRNKSDKTLYIDLGNCFISTNDESRCYYTPSSTAKTEGRSHGVGVNLGLVSVGGGTSSAETKTVFAQRLLAIPPMSAKNLESQQILFIPVPEMAVYCEVVEDEVFPRCQIDAARYPRVPEGATWTFEPYEETIRFSVMATCSFDEKCAETFTLRRGFYVDRTACYKNRPGAKFWDYDNPLVLMEKGRQRMLEAFPEWDSWGDYFVLYPFNSGTNSWVEP